MFSVYYCKSRNYNGHFNLTNIANAVRTAHVQLQVHVLVDVVDKVIEKDGERRLLALTRGS